MSVMSRPCQAEDSDGEECDCLTFSPKSTNPDTCRSCLHKKRQHPRLSDTIPSLLKKMKEEHESGGGILSKISEAKQESLSGMRPLRKSVKLGKVSITAFFWLVL